MEGEKGSWGKGKRSQTRGVQEGDFTVVACTEIEIR